MPYRIGVVEVSLLALLVLWQVLAAAVGLHAHRRRANFWAGYALALLASAPLALLLLAAWRRALERRPRICTTCLEPIPANGVCPSCAAGTIPLRG